MSLNVDLFANREEFSEEYAWGKLLSDLTRHLANAISLTRGEDHALIVSRIRDAYSTQLEKRDGAVVGTFITAPRKP